MIIIALAILAQLVEPLTPLDAQATLEAARLQATDVSRRAAATARADRAATASAMPTATATLPPATSTPIAPTVTIVQASATPAPTMTPLTEPTDIATATLQAPAETPARDDFQPLGLHPLTFVVMMFAFAALCGVVLFALRSKRRQGGR